MNDLSIFENNPLANSDLFKDLLETNKRLSGNSGGRRISIRGGRFREIVGGEQMRVNSTGSMNVVVLKSSLISRSYYKAEYDPDNTGAPDCWSPDSETPSTDVPADKRMSASCRDCPMDVKGSGTGDSRACRFSVRLALAIEGDLTKVYQMQLPATSLFGDPVNNDMAMQSYAKMLQENNMPMIGVVTQMYFDENSETPKLFFKPVRPVTEAEIGDLLKLADSPEAEQATTFIVRKQDNDKDAGASNDAAEAEAEAAAAAAAAAAKAKAAKAKAAKAAKAKAEAEAALAAAEADAGNPTQDAELADDDELTAAIEAAKQAAIERISGKRAKAKAEVDDVPEPTRRVDKKPEIDADDAAAMLDAWDD